MDLQLSRRNFLLSSAALGTLAAFGGVNVANADPAEKIIVGRAVDSDDLDPVTCTGNQNIFIFNLILDGLLKSSDDGSAIEPCLATDMPEISEDGKVYTFHVQEGLLFSDGSPVTAEDWEWTFTRAIETEDSSWHMCVENLDHVECPDDTTVIVYTKEEAASTLANLCIFTLGVQSKAYFEKVGADEYHNGILGTGPYAVSEWKKGEYLTLEANPNYRVEGKPLTKTVEFKIVSDDAARIIQLQGGDIDIATDLSFSGLMQLEGDPNINVEADPSTMVYWLSLNSKSEKLADPKVREALYLATNSQEFVDTITFGYATPASSIINPTSEFYYASDQPSGDIEKAKALLAEAGVGPFELTLLMREGNETYQQIGMILMKQWAQIGVTVNFNQIEATAYSAARKDLSNYDLIISGWNDDVTDPAEMMQFVFDYSVTCGYYSGMEFDDEMQQLNSAALIELDEEKRKDLYAQIQQKLRELAIYVPLMVTPWCNAMNKAVTGWVQTPLGNYRLENLAREA